MWLQPGWKGCTGYLDQEMALPIAPSGKLGVVFDIEGMRRVQQNHSLVQTFYELGVR